MINVNQITAQLARMPDQALQQFAAMHKTDPYTLSLALSESNRRKQMRQGAQMEQQPQPKVVDQELAQMGAPAMPPQGMPQGVPQQLPEDVGIGQLPAPNMQRMAAGGIVAFEEGGEVPGYAGGGNTQAIDYRQAIIDEAQLQGVPAAVALQISGVESGFNPNARPIDPKTGKPRSSATSFFQVIDKTFKDLGGDPDKRTDPMENIRVGVKSLAQNQAALTKTLGRPPKPQELYTTHFLGTETGSKLLTADAAMPIGKFLASADPKNKDKIIAANPEVLGGKKTVGDVMAWSEQKMLPVLTGGAAVAAEVPAKGPEKAGLPSLASPTRSGAVANKLEQQRRRNELPDAIKQVQANRAASAAQIPGQGETGAGYRSDMSVEDEARALINDRIEAEKKGTFFGRLGENLGLSAQTRDVIGKGVEGLAPYMGGAARVVRAPVPAVQASKPLPLRLSGPPAVQADAGLPGLVPRLEGPSSIVGGSKPIPVNPEGVATLPRTGELVGQAAVDEARLRMLADASNAAKAQRAQNLKTGEQLLAQKYDVNAAKAADDAAMAASKLDNAVPATRLANTIDQGAIQAANVAKVGAMTNAADRKIAGMEGGLPDMAKAMNLDEENRVIQQAPPDIAPKDIEKIGKEATPKSDRKGMSGEDFLMIGLGILSGQSPNALVNIGEGGLKGLQMVQASRKEASEAAAREMMAERYGIGAEVQLVNAMRDPTFAANYRTLVEAKNDPRQMQALAQEMLKTPGQMEMLKKLDPTLYEVLRKNVLGGLMPTPLSSPGATAPIRAPIPIQ
jgi:hypothetical protein